MKYLFLFSLSLAFLGCNSTKKAERIFGSELFAHWVHSHEEDSANSRVFRLSNYAFPPSRGREGLEIKSDGVFVHHQIGPVDAPVVVNGKWKMQGNDAIRIIPETGEAWTLHVLEVDQGILKVK